MPLDETEGLGTNCFLERNEPREVLISKNKIKFKNLNKNSMIGTSSFRREFQLKNKRSDLNYKLVQKYYMYSTLHSTCFNKMA